MKHIILIILLLSVCILKAENNPAEVTSEIKEVTVFLNKAQITRSGTINLQAGITEWKFANLPSDIDERSIRIKGEGNFTVMSVSFLINHLKEQEKTREIEKLLDQKEILNDKISLETDMLSVYQQEEAVILENKKIGGNEIGVQVLELKEMANFYRQKLSEIKIKQTEVKKNIRKLNEQMEKLNAQLHALHSIQNKPTGEIVVSLSSKQNANAKVILTYITANAGWFPSYDVRVKDVASPISLVYKANVFQQSGEDWKGVKLRLSTADPSLGGTRPFLSPNLLARYSYSNNYKNYPGVVASPPSGPVNPSIRNVNGKVIGSDGAGIPGVNVVVKGTTVGTATNAEGNYSIQIPVNSTSLVYSFIGYVSQERNISNSVMDIQLMEDISNLQEVVVIGYGTVAGMAVEDYSAPIREKKSIIPLETAQIVKSTSVEFEIKTPYSIASTGKHLAVEMEEYSIPAYYEYYAVPKLDKDAFLSAKVTGWEDLNLLQGEANLFFEETYVGKSLIDPLAATDTLTLSLGRDKSITIERKQVKSFVSKQFIGGNKKETRGFEIVVRNNKALPINLILEDQIPVSTVKEIQVESIEISQAAIEKDSGKLTWNLNVKPAEVKKLDLKYEVKYPKELKLILD